VLCLDNRAWQIDILRDTADQIAIAKASKVGVTELMVAGVFYEASRGNTGMYVLPTHSVRSRFVTTRIDPMLLTVPHYAANVSRTRKDVDAKGEKTLFGKTWAFVGSNNPKDFYEFTADMMVIDELDQCQATSLVYAADRTGSARADRWWKLGNPTVENSGIDAIYRASDAKVWMVRCTHCNHEQPLTWFKNFVFQDDSGHWQLRSDAQGLTSLQKSGGGGVTQDASAVCIKCGGLVDRLSQGAWVPQFAGRPVSGYQVSRLFGAPGNDNATRPRPIIREEFAHWLAAQSNATKLQAFYNNRLGLPFAAEGSKITEAVLARCESDYTMPETAEATVAGVDVGSVFHVHVEQVQNGIRRKLFVGTVRDWNDLQLLCHRYGVMVGVIDAMPEQHAAKEWCEHHPGWYRCNYSVSEKGKMDIRVDHLDATIACNRTASLDESYEHWLRGQVEIPRDWRTLDGGDFVSQMCAATRVYDEDKQRYEWRENNQPDHHQHADNYCRLAATEVSGRPGVWV